jgi:dTDP-4-amino-4,6-dideoxygalactose transaminase
MRAEYTIPFNKPFLTGSELDNIKQAIRSGKISGNGMFTRECHQFFTNRYGFPKVLLTTSCTHALEMAALLIDCKSGDEIIIPSYTFVSTANAFIIRGARVVFADSGASGPALDISTLESLVTKKTRAIVPVHYGGIACNMDPVMELAARHGLFVIEDAAQAIESSYKGKQLGGIGHLGTFSFHETKNINAGEGGMLTVNEASFRDRSEIIWEKGTNRSAFFRGEVDKYNWIDIGSSYLPSEITAAFLYGQLEHIEEIQRKRIRLWELYDSRLKPLEEKGMVTLPHIPPYATNNGHLYYMVLPDHPTRTGLINHLKSKGILAVFHYLPLHRSPFFRSRHDGRELPFSEKYGDCLLRLPMYFELEESQVNFICDQIYGFFGT